MTDALKVITAVDAAETARARDMASFRFNHGMAGAYQTVTLEDIRAIAHQLLEEKRYDQVFYRRGSETDASYAAPGKHHEVEEALAALNTSNAWVRLTRVDEVSPRFQAVVEKFYDDLSELHQTNIRDDVMKTFVTLFISSPNVVTPYHMDHTWNYLLQVQGSKTVYLYDAHDEEILPQAEIERWYMRSFQIKKHKDTPMAYDLKPGDGVHHPVNAPHWVQNGPEISISLSLGVCRHDANEAAKVHQVNYLLRSAGMKPPRPGEARLRDGVKAGFLTMFSDRNPQSLGDVLFSGRDRLRSVARGARNLLRGGDGATADDKRLTIEQ